MLSQRAENRDLNYDRYSKLREQQSIGDPGEKGEGSIFNKAGVERKVTFNRVLGMYQCASEFGKGGGDCGLRRKLLLNRSAQNTQHRQFSQIPMIQDILIVEANLEDILYVLDLMFKR